MIRSRCPSQANRFDAFLQGRTYIRVGEKRLAPIGRERNEVRPARKHDDSPARWDVPPMNRVDTRPMLAITTEGGRSSDPRPTSLFDQRLALTIKDKSSKC